MYNDLNLFSDWAALFGGSFLIGIMLVLLLVVPFLVVYIIASWKLFKKAGKNGWEAIIPFYNNWVMVEISGLDWWWFLLMLAPTILGMFGDDLAGLASLVSFFATFNCWYNISKRFKKDDTMAVVAGIFSFVFVFIFAFSKNNKYYAEEKVSKYGILGKLIEKENTTNENKPVNKTEAKNTEEDKVCAHCGAKLDGDYKFCPKCGKEL